MLMKEGDGGGKWVVLGEVVRRREEGRREGKEEGEGECVCDYLEPHLSLLSTP